MALCVLSFPEILVPPSSSSSSHQLDIEIPPSIQPLTTPHTLFLLNKSDLVSHILPLAPSFFISPQSDQVDEGISTTHLNLIPTPSTPIKMQKLDASGSSFHSQAWSTSLVTNQGTHEFVQGLAEVLKSRYVIRFSPPFLNFLCGQNFSCALFFYLGNLFKSVLLSSFNINDQTINKTHAPLITRARHRVHLESACRFLKAFLDTRKYLFFFSSQSTYLILPSASSDIVLAAEELRYAAQAVGRVTGEIGTEDVLDALFKGFCIGKWASEKAERVGGGKWQ